MQTTGRQYKENTEDMHSNAKLKADPTIYERQEDKENTGQTGKTTLPSRAKQEGT